jgi:dCMP deaminase
MEQARAYAERTDCTRTKCAALIIKDNRLIAAGYPGTKPGRPGCLMGACPRGQHFDTGRIYRPALPSYEMVLYPDGTSVCNCGKAWPCPDAAEPGSSYDTGPGACISVHAEMNAIMAADKSDRRGACMYVTREPCAGCRKHIEVSGIVLVLWPTERGGIHAWLI